MPFVFPKIYPILDASAIPASNRAAFLNNLGTSLADAGVTLLEYRNKTGSDAELLADAAVLRAALPKSQVRLILDDRADLVAQIDFDGVHVDAGDRTPAEARALLGPEAIIGTFGGSESLVPGVLAVPADYFSIGPIAYTTTKQTAKPPIGVEGVRRLRAEAGPAPARSRSQCSRCLCRHLPRARSCRRVSPLATAPEVNGALGSKNHGKLISSRLQ